jgi:Rrf2 family protein
VHLSARVDYALRAAVELAALGANAQSAVTAERIATAQRIPLRFLDNILLAMRRAGIVESQRGPEGGYWLARPAEKVSLAHVIRAVDGPLANVRGRRPEHLGYRGTAIALQDVWIALRASEREILDGVTVANVASGQLPAQVRSLAARD